MFQALTMNLARSASCCATCFASTALVYSRLRSTEIVAEEAAQVEQVSTSGGGSNGSTGGRELGCRHSYQAREGKQAGSQHIAKRQQPPTAPT